ncbi:hypothetical protein [Planomonospora parontospora]|uniref:hypothetical protein n=1 Tax=Planomonospora parontospora TaxID=58119 RepID=UPI001670EE6C|nr:hypothetical protein [Planomonospora parontospora]GGL13633.1 hypothetical protein GCM10014719_14440 [Planomonospora parontospora subsp. antibiotica]GII13895.1 hypothetical protein Ppa05_06210 [Planomonospora parontospora subsp. antibiotica]
MSAMKAVSAGPFELKRDGDRFSAGIRVLERELERVTLEAVLAKANRAATRRGAAGSGAFGSMRPRPVDWYCFDAADNAFPDWYPQGLTCSSDAGAAGNVFVVSWYYKPEAGERGVRLSFLNAATLRYRHVLLVEARADGGIAPIDIHAGGVAWYGHLLYVADTVRGFRVFDTRQIFEVNGGDDRAIGGKKGVYDAFGYRYVMPQTGAWTTTTGAARFSFAAVDRSADPDLLISGEYVDEPGETGRVARWRLDPDGALRAGADGVAAALDAYALPAGRIQGALSYDGAWYLSQGAGSQRNGTLIEVGDGIVRRPYPVGPEDLACVRGRGQVWSVTEFVGRRVIYGVPL